MSTSFRSSRPDAWADPRPYSDASLRRMTYGRVQPMKEEAGFLSRLFGAL